MKEKFKTFNFNAEKLSILNACNGYIERTRRAGYMVTLRQVYYFTISSDILPESWIDEDYNRKHGLAPDTKNTIKNYKRLGELLNDGRIGGMVDWEAMEDRTRNMEKNSHWTSPSEIMQACASSFAINKWLRQPNYVEVWVEKDALVGVLEKCCRALDVPYFSCRGYASSSELYSAGKRLKWIEEEEQRPVIIYLGDHDPSGLDMTRDIEDRVTTYGNGVNVEVRRIALTKEQIEEVDAPANPAKLTDSRAEAYMAEHGDDSWELDALPIEYLDRIITQTVIEYRDQDLWDEAVEEEKTHKRLLKKASDQWEAIVNLLEGQE